MSQNPKDENEKIVELAKARKQMQTLKAQKDQKKSPPPGYMNGQPAPKSSPVGRRSFWEYVQLIFFLAMAAYMMQLCSGGI